MMTLIREKSRVRIDLPNGPPMNAGGEGKVYQLSPHECVKIYHNPLTDSDIEKINYLTTVQPLLPGFAWPIELVRLANETRSCGYVMPFVEGQNLDDFMDMGVPFRRKTAIRLCFDVASYVQNAHAFMHSRIILGDVIKAGNLIVSDDGRNVAFIDCASVNLLNLRSRNGSVSHSTNRLVTPGYTAPERLADPQLQRNQKEDNFALAVLLFEILYGMAPTRPKPTPATTGYSPDDYVMKGYFFRFVNVPHIPAPTYPNIKLPHEIDSLFRDAFLSNNRPSATDWVTSLSAWANKKIVQPQASPAQPKPQPQTPYQPIPQPIHPQPQPASPVQPQPLIMPGQVQPRPAAPPPLTPVNQTKPPIRILVPSLRVMYWLCIIVVNLLDTTVRHIFSIPRTIVDLIVNGITDLFDYLIHIYLSLASRAFRLAVIAFVSLLAYRIFTADTSIIPASSSSYSRTVSHLVKYIFGPDSNNPEEPQRLPPPPSTNSTPSILDQVLR